ncbi:hypothetical protein CULT_570018 [[Clostridium] ultunense Esp]|uniref:Uncharacterized protein n=1 Tax=[Clostridium] ultunense Esp TaxID=1288971 RepID=M1Z2M5_9FIRM|nr:hypothetical protein [Schnuerera ultunensis]CCQ97115.1 hypothetical protein CULT_570018 [[Clostridium] ultunense Esp]SHD78485.1 conserved protein of unknown function [[Clostridium] ultunense Esp]
MKKDDKVKKAMEEFEGFKPSEEQIELIEGLANSYSDKSEEDIFVEIIRVNEEMESEMSPEEYEEIFEKLNSIRPLLNEEQLKKLDRILYILGKD